MTMTTTTPANGAELAKRGGPKTLKDLLEAAKGRIQAVIPKHLSTDRLIKIALVAVSKDKTGKLAQCTSESVLLAVMQAAELGLEIGGSLGDAYLVPYKKSWKDDSGKWHSAMEAQCITGYRGFISLARRSGEISSISAHVVHANDKFKIVYGLEEKLEHEPLLTGDPGDLIAVYAICAFKDGGKQVEVMTRAQVIAIRDRVKPGDYKPKPGEVKELKGPWLTDEEEMWRKTVVRRLAKYLPLSPELKTQIEKEDEIEDTSTIDVLAEAAAASLPEGTSPTKKLAAKIGKNNRASAGEAEPETVPAIDGDGEHFNTETGEVPDTRQPGEEG